MSCCECCGLWIVLGLRVAGDCVELWNVSKSRLDRTWRQNANLLRKMQVLLTTTHRCIATIPASIDLSIQFISFASLFAPFFYFVYKSTKQKTFKQSCSAILIYFRLKRGNCKPWVVVQLKKQSIIGIAQQKVQFILNTEVKMRIQEPSKAETSSSSRINRKPDSIESDSITGAEKRAILECHRGWSERFICRVFRK